MEEKPTLASHRMEISLVVLLLGHLIILTYGHPILKAPVSVVGTWKGDMTLHCIYDPLRGYSQVLVKWKVQRGSDPVTIFLRDSSGDHIQQAKYRGRLKVNHNVPGDVSLQLNALQMDDRNHYTCEVTWQTPDGNQVVRDKIIELHVQKYSSNPHIINTEPLSTMQSSLEATTNVKSTCEWTTKVNEKLEETTKVNEKLEETTKANEKLEETTKVNEKLEETTKMNEKLEETTMAVNETHGPRRELATSAIICIAVLCCIVVVTIAYIMFCSRIFKKEHVYEVSRVCAKETSNSEETTFTNGCFSVAPDFHALINDYSDEPCLGQEYQITTQFNNDYSCMLHTVPRNSEVLATENNSIC